MKRLEGYQFSSTIQPEIISLQEVQFSHYVEGFARQYAPYLGVDYDRDILPNLSDRNWWAADYGVKLVEGKEIGMSLKDAFKCLVDNHRTFVINQGIGETVNYLKSKKSEVVGIDAGTGTGILSILMLTSGVDRVYAIEINEQTFEVTMDFLHQLQLDDRIILLKGDATDIDLGDVRGDLLVSENLSSGLMDEPQYAIINHLSDFLYPDAEIIPFRGQLSISFGTADWEGIYPEKWTLAARRLKAVRRETEPVSYASVDSTWGMAVPIISGNAIIPTTCDYPLNTLLLHSRFHINRVGIPYIIEPDSAQFLGKTDAFRLENPVCACDGIIAVDFRYEVGRKAKEMKVLTDGNHISFSDPYLK